MNGPRLSVPELVTEFQQFDFKWWYTKPGTELDARVPNHERGVETVRHALHHFMKSMGPVHKGRSDWELMQLVGMIFETACRLLGEAVVNPSQVTQRLEREFEHAREKVRASPARGVDHYLANWYQEYLGLVPYLVDFEDGRKFDYDNYCTALRNFVDYLLVIAVVAMRGVARYRRVGVNDFNRDPSIIDKYWCEAASKRLEYLRAKH